MVTPAVFACLLQSGCGESSDARAAGGSSHVRVHLVSCANRNTPRHHGILVSGVQHHQQHARVCRCGSR